MNARRVSQAPPPPPDLIVLEMTVEEAREVRRILGNTSSDQAARAAGTSSEEWLDRIEPIYFALSKVSLR